MGLSADVNEPQERGWLRWNSAVSLRPPPPRSSQRVPLVAATHPETVGWLATVDVWLLLMAIALLGQHIAPLCVLHWESQEGGLMVAAKRCGLRQNKWRCSIDCLFSRRVWGPFGCLSRRQSAVCGRHSAVCVGCTSQAAPDELEALWEVCILIDENDGLLQSGWPPRRQISIGIEWSRLERICDSDSSQRRLFGDTLGVTPRCNVGCTLFGRLVKRLLCSKLSSLIHCLLWCYSCLEMGLLSEVARECKGWISDEFSMSISSDRKVFCLSLTASYFCGL